MWATLAVSLSGGILNETQDSAGSWELKLSEFEVLGGQNNTANRFGRSFNLFSPESAWMI